MTIENEMKVGGVLSTLVEAFANEVTQRVMQKVEADKAAIPAEPVPSMTEVLKDVLEQSDWAKEMVREHLSNGQLDELVTNHMESRSFQRELEEAVNNVDLDDKVENVLDIKLEGVLKDKIEDALRDHDFSDDVESAIDDYDLDDKIKEALDSYDFSDAVLDALKTILKPILK